MHEAKLLQSIFKDSGDLVVILQPNRTVLTANPAFIRTVPGGAAGADFMDLVAPRAKDHVIARLVRAAGGDEVVVEVLHGQNDRSTVLVEYSFFPIDGGMVAGLGRVRSDDRTAREALGRAQAELQEKSRILDEIQLELTQVPFIDPVTGVWNRMQVIERLTAEWSRSERYGSPVSCLLIDVENLGDIRRRDEVAGDELLKAVARRLKSVARDHDIVGRFGGDCFVVVAVQADSEGAKSLARRIHEMVGGEPVAADQHALSVSLRIGAATNRSEGVEILEDLFSVAETALHDARAQDLLVKVAEEVHV